MATDADYLTGVDLIFLFLGGHPCLKWCATVETQKDQQRIYPEVLEIDSTIGITKVQPIWRCERKTIGVNTSTISNKALISMDLCPYEPASDGTMKTRVA